MPVEKLLLQVIENTMVSAKVFRTRFVPLQDNGQLRKDSVNFLAGQFMSLKVADNARRSYSISSASTDSFIETYVDIAPGGPGSKFFESAQKGNTVQALMPLGMFFFNPTTEDRQDSPVVLVATGTGITPFMAILKMHLERFPNVPFYLFWGIRYVQDLFLQEELKELAVKYHNFKFFISLSRPDHTWNGLTGYCTKQLLDRWNEISEVQNASFYLCGHGEMIAEAKEMLEGKGVKEAMVYSEKFS